MKIWIASIALWISLMGGMAYAAAEPSPSVQLDMVIAEAFWGRSPTQCLSITYGTTVKNPAWDGEATRPEPGFTGPCIFNIVDGLINPVYECVLVVHEYGHLLGEIHSPDPTNVMHEGSLAEVVIPACQELAPKVPAQPETTTPAVAEPEPAAIKEKHRCHSKKSKYHKIGLRCRVKVKE